MRRLIRHSLILWLALIVVCAAAIMLARLGHTPTVLQILGFDICDGTPCFKGLKPGTDWAQVPTPLVNQGTWYGSYLDLPNTMPGVKRMGISKIGATIGYLTMGTGADSDALPITAADVIAQYGPPCVVVLQYRDTVYGNMVLVYPQLQARAYTKARLQVDSPIFDFIIYGDGESASSCNASRDATTGAWRGFTSAQDYRLSNLRDTGLTDDQP